MRSYIARRIVQGLLVLWLVSFAVFSLVRIMPGDAVLMQLDAAAAPTPEMLARARQELGLDRPFLQQYRTWMAGVAHGDLGRSLISRRPVTQELAKRISLTSHLAVMSMIIALLIALPIGVLAAVRQDTPADYVGRLSAILGLSLPDFWLATVTITLLSIWFQWMPPIGFAPIWEDPARNLSQLLIPAAEQHRKDYVFLVPATWQQNYAVFAKPVAAHITLDGQALDSAEFSSCTKGPIGTMMLAAGGS